MRLEVNDLRVESKRFGEPVPRGIDLNALLGKRMGKRKGDGAQAQQVIVLDVLVPMVERVAENWVTGLGEVDANLMGAAGDGFAGDQRLAVLVRDELELGFGGFAVAFVRTDFAGLLVQG